MARGDVVAGLLTASGSYQPAAGVEVMITQLTLSVTTDGWSIYDGTNLVAAYTGANYFNVRIPINNSVYLWATIGAGNRGSYHGIQTK